MATDLGSLGTAFIDIVARQDKLDNQFASLKSGVRSFATTLGVTLGAAGIVQGFRTLIGAASDFESSFAGVRKTVKATEPEFANMAASLRGLSKEIPLSVNQLNAIAETAGQLGIEKGAIIDFTKTIANLAATTNLSAEQAATSIAQFANVMGTASSEFSNIGSAISGLGNISNATEADIVNMAQGIAATGNQVGLSESQVLGFATALASVGIQAQAGGTALSRLFSQINVAVATSNKELAQFAEIAMPNSTNATKEFAELFKKDAGEAVTLFVEGLTRIKESGGSAIVALENLGITEVRMRDALLSLAASGGDVRQFLVDSARLYKENNATTKEAAERYKTFDSQVQLLKSSFNDLLITIGSKMLPALTEMVKSLRGMIELAQEGEGPIANLTAAIIALTAAFVIGKLIAYGEAIYAVILAAGTARGTVFALEGAFGVMTASSWSAVTALGALRVALLAAAPPLAIAAGIAVIAYEVWNLGQAIHQLEVAQMNQKNAESVLHNATMEAITAMQKRGQITAEQARSMRNEFMLLNQEIEKNATFDIWGTKTGSTAKDAQAKLQALEMQIGRLGQEWVKSAKVQNDANATIEAGAKARAEAEAKRREEEKQRAKERAEEAKRAVDEFKSAMAPADEFNKILGYLSQKFTDVQIVKVYGEQIAEAAKTQRAHGLEVKGAVAHMANMYNLMELMSNLEPTDLSKLVMPNIDTAKNLDILTDKSIFDMPDDGPLAGPEFSDTTQKAIDRIGEAKDQIDDLKVSILELKARGKSAAEIQKILRTEISAAGRAAEEYGFKLDPVVQELVDMNDAGKKSKDSSKVWQEAWGNVMGNIMTDFNRSLSDIFFNRGNRSIGEIFSEFGKTAGKAMFETFTATATKPLFELFNKWSEQLAGILSEAIKGIGQWFMQLTKPLFDLFGGWAKKLGDVIGGALKSVFSKIGGWLMDALDGVGGFLKSTLGGVFGGIGKSLGGLLGIGGQAAGVAAGVGGGAASGAAGGVMGALGLGGGAGLLGLGAATIPVVGGAIAGAILLAKSLIGRGRRTADEFTGQVQDPFGDQLGVLVDSFAQAKASGDLTLDSAKATRDATVALIAGFQKSGEEFASQGKIQTKVWQQATATMTEYFGEGFSKVLDPMAATIDDLTAKTTDAAGATTDPSKDGTTSELGDRLIAGIPHTGLAASASTIFADAVTMFKDIVTNMGMTAAAVPGDAFSLAVEAYRVASETANLTMGSVSQTFMASVDKFAATVETLSTLPMTAITVDSPVALTVEFNVDKLDDPAAIRDKVIPEITALLETGGRTFREKVAKIIGETLRGMISGGAATA